MRITAQGPCCGGWLQKKMQERQTFWQLGRNHKQCPTTIKPPEKGAGGCAYSEGLDEDCAAKPGDGACLEIQSRLLSQYAAHRISRYPSVYPM